MELSPLVDSETYLKAMFFGDPGSGKTTAAASMAQLGKILIVDLESGLRARPLDKLGIPTENISVVKLKTYEEMVKVCQEVAKALAADPGKYVGFVLDSVTEMQDKFTENLTSARVRKSATRGVKDDEFEIDGDTRIRASGQVLRICRMLRDLPCHTVFNALQKEDKETDGTIYYRPMLGPKTATAVASYVNIVTHLSLEPSDAGAIRIGRSSPVGKYRGKDNIADLPERMLNPSFDRILKVVRGELTPEEVDADKAHEASTAAA